LRAVLSQWFISLPSLLPGGGKAGVGEGGANLFSGAYRKGVIMGCLLFVFQQFSGINAIVYFSSSVFKQVSGVQDMR
jgi:hypothetical protein